MTKLIPLSRGLHALVDDQDFDVLAKKKWYAANTRAGFYAVRNSSRRLGKRCGIYMHREILGVPAGAICDHVNGNTLDNRRQNLRLATSVQNRTNSRIQKNNKAGYKGVSYETRRGAWRADIHLPGKHIFLGYFSEAKSAAKAYNDAASEYYGAFARLN